MKCNRINRFMVMGFIFFGWLGVSRASQIEILSYNLENLFNVDHDTDGTGADKNDYEFLPKSNPIKAPGCKKSDPGFRKQCLDTDWTDEKLGWKIDNIKKVLDEHGSLPDIMAVVEVENEAVLKRLAKRLGYDDAVLTNGDDERGIDVGLMYRSSKNFKPVTESDGKVGVDEPTLLSNPTRNLFKARFTLDGKPLTVFVNHFPSGPKGVDDRLVIARKLKKFMAQDAKENPNVFQIAVGDFNIIPEDKPLGKDAAEKVLTVAEDGEPLDEVAELFWNAHKAAGDEDSVRETFPKGTFFFVGNWSWNTLDRFFVRKDKASKSAIKVVENSYTIVSVPSNRSTLTGKTGKGAGKTEKDIPRKCFHGRTSPEAIGVSDHFPTSVKLQTVN